jgi:uncharacterized membrane protein (UPF0127 family)
MKALALLAAALAAAAVLALALFASGASQPGRQQARADVALPDGFLMDVPVASSPDEVARGLSGVPSVGEGEGMLFRLLRPGQRFWMKGMLTRIDIVFASCNGTVTEVYANLPPCGEEPCAYYAPSPQACYALELAANASERHGVVPGSVLEMGFVG